MEKTATATAADDVGPLQSPPPVYQLPEWETASRPGRRSRLGRLLPSSEAAGGAGAGVVSGEGATESAHRLKSRPASWTTSFWRSTRSAVAAVRARSTGTAIPTAPGGSYSGRGRRRFSLVYVVLPLAVLLLLLLPLALGLGLGLGLRGGPSSRAHADPPLPWSANGQAILTGELTYYSPGLGACGIVSSDSDAICAVSHVLYDAASRSGNPNDNALCGRRIRVGRDFVEQGSGNRTVDVTVVDRCVGCVETDLDLSISVFLQLAPEASGRVTGSWAWLEG